MTSYIEISELDPGHAAVVDQGWAHYNDALDAILAVRAQTNPGTVPFGISLAEHKLIDAITHEQTPGALMCLLLVAIDRLAHRIDPVTAALRETYTAAQLDRLAAALRQCAPATGAQIAGDTWTSLATRVRAAAELRRREELDTLADTAHTADSD